MDINRKTLQSLATSIPCLIAFVLLLKCCLAFFAGVFSCPLIDSMSTGDLLNGIGTFAAVVFAVVSYKCDSVERRKKEEEDLERAKPQIKLECSERDYGFFITITNMGSRFITNIMDGEGNSVVSRLGPGISFSYAYVSRDAVGVFDIDFDDVASIVSSIRLEAGTLLALVMYDTSGRAWEVAYSLDGEEANLASDLSLINPSVIKDLYQ